MTTPRNRLPAMDSDESSDSTDDAVGGRSIGAGFDIDDASEGIRQELQEVSSGDSDGDGSDSSGSGEAGGRKGRKAGKRGAKRKKQPKSAWSSVGSKASSSSAGTKMSGLVKSASSKASTAADRDERYLKEFAALSKKRSPLNKKFKFKGKHLVYHGMDPNEAPSEEVEFESDWAPILIRASGKRMNPRKVQNMLPLLKQKIGQLVMSDPGMKRVIRPVYLRCTEPPRHIGFGFTVCFNYPGFSLTHAEVKAAVESRLRDAVQMPFTVSCIQFLPLASQLDIPGIENRWLLTLSRNDAKLELIRFGLKLRTTYVTVRDYGDVQRIEIAVWTLLNQDKCESAGSSRDFLTTTPSSADGPNPAVSASAASSARSYRTISSADTSSAMLNSVIGSDIDRVKHLLMRRRNTYAELRHILTDR